MEAVKSEPLLDGEVTSVVSDDSALKIEFKDEIMSSKHEAKTEEFEVTDPTKIKIETEEECNLAADDLIKLLPESILKNDKVDLEAIRVEMARNPNFKPVLRNGPYSKSADGNHICDVCNKSFGDNFNLTIHNRIHTGERPHACAECGKSFTQYSNLKIHQLVHSDERPHSCHTCGKNFRRMAHLQKHMLLHTGQRPHVCSLCSKTFLCNTDLKNHSFTHSQDKPHKCETCAKTFATPARLRRHQYTHKTTQ